MIKLKRPLSSSSKGYTLVEVMVAAVILAIGVGGMMLMISQSLNSLRMVKEWTYPLNLARDGMEKVSKLHGATIGGTYYDEGAIHNKIHQPEGGNLDYPFPESGEPEWWIRYRSNMEGSSLQVWVDVYEADAGNPKITLTTFIEDWPP